MGGKYIFGRCMSFCIFKIIYFIYSCCKINKKVYKWLKCLLELTERKKKYYKYYNEKQELEMFLHFPEKLLVILLSTFLWCFYIVNWKYFVISISETSHQNQQILLSTHVSSLIGWQLYCWSPLFTQLLCPHKK